MTININILTVIEKRKPSKRTYHPGEKVYYETADGNVVPASVAASGSETSYFTNGDWAYNTQIVAARVIPVKVNK